jgi:hypothetical protein
LATSAKTKPDETPLGNLVSFGTDGNSVNVLTLPTTSTYTIFIDPGALNPTDTGSVTLTVPLGCS